ncbi:MAG: helix-turn-helix domain-containing protein, partial [Candidatus Limosilactobacillus intestinavium]
MQLTLKALRVNQGMTQEEAAKAVGVSEYTWSNYERGKSFPNVPTIKS